MKERNEDLQAINAGSGNLYNVPAYSVLEQLCLLVDNYMSGTFSNS
jgi:hypothetical protein